MGKLTGKVAVITGGSSGIGRATCLLFASEGAKVVLGDLDEKGGNETVEMIKKAGGQATFTRCDVTKESDVKDLFEKAVAAYGTVDVLFSNAGIEMVRTVDTTTEADWNRIMDINVKGVFYCAKHAVPIMKKNAAGGSIINAGSIAGVISTPMNIAYCASKGAVVNMTRAMAVEFAPFKIRVNATCPAGIITPMMNREIEAYGKPREQSMREWVAAHPIGRMGGPEEVAKAVLFLASDDSSFTTGSLLMVDGGYTAV
jgi:NAD(P)-dependent dehydrogenase (short-subunit alcohol dehydrogenase family)